MTGVDKNRFKNSIACVSNAPLLNLNLNLSGEVNGETLSTKKPLLPANSLMISTLVTPAAEPPPSPILIQPAAVKSVDELTPVTVAPVLL